MNTYDVIIIGGGAAGCAAARRLIDDGRLSVVIIEEGRRDTNPFIHIPATFFKVLASRDAKIVKTDAEQQLGDRQYAIPQGRVLGGGSSVNAMNYIRGQPEDYDSWVADGADGWGYDDVLPIFKRQENNQRLAHSPFHGNAGPLTVSDPEKPHVLHEAFIDAAVEGGLPRNTDFNGASQLGVGFYQTTTRANRRASAAQAFVRPVLNNRNLAVITGHKVVRIICQNGVATGVLVQAPSGEKISISARHEVLVAAGALASPQILQTSGIGPRLVLEKAGVECLVESNGVGNNFQDHIAALYTVLIKEPLSLFNQDRGFSAVRNGINYLLFKQGVLASTIIESGGFLDTTHSGKRPDIQLNGQAIVAGPPGHPPIPDHGFGVGIQLNRPKSRGFIHIRTPDLSDPPIFFSKLLTDMADVEVIKRGLNIARDIFAEAPLRQLTKSVFYPPSGDMSAKSLETYIRTHGRTVYHPCGTCRMGQDDVAVVDPTLAVRGVRRLRVIDASVMPRITSGNTNAPSMMIGERGAEYSLQSL
jgi:choline dehydrogenase-like flavoprotein